MLILLISTTHLDVIKYKYSEIAKKHWIVHNLKSSRPSQHYLHIWVKFMGYSIAYPLNIDFDPSTSEAH